MPQTFKKKQKKQSLNCSLPFFSSFCRLTWDVTFRGDIDEAELAENLSRGLPLQPPKLIFASWLPVSFPPPPRVRDSMGKGGAGAHLYHTISYH